EARGGAWMVMMWLIRCSLTGGDGGWMTNSSCPRIASWFLTLISPSGKCRRRGSVRGTPSFSEMRSASSGLALPAMSFSAPQGEASSPVNSTAVVNLPIIFLPYHPSWNTDGCRALGDVFRDDRACPGAGALAKFDGSDQHRVHPDERPVADLGPVLLDAVEVRRDRTGADVGILAKVGVAEVRDVGHLAVPAHLRPHQLGEAADVDVLGDLGAGSDLHDRPAFVAVADPRVLYVNLRDD